MNEMTDDKVQTIESSGQRAGVYSRTSSAVLRILGLIYPWIKQKWSFFDEKILLPWTIRACGYLRKKIAYRIQKYHLIHDWKEKVFEDFSAWLAALPEKPATGETAAMDACDLFTLLSEFTALRQEIRIQNREQGKTLSTLTGFIEAYQETASLFKDRTRALSELEENIRKSSEKRTVMPFLEVRDALVRGLAASAAIAASKRFFRPAPKGIESVVEGYEMAIRRMDWALTSVNVIPVETVGNRFDPKTMKALVKRNVSGMEKGVVVEEMLTGYVRGQEVLRTAEVVVSE